DTMRAIRVLAVLSAFAAVVAGCGAAARTDPSTVPTVSSGVPHLDPYKAAVSYAQCMRARGIPHPNPDPNGDFHLTPAQEQRMRAAATLKQRQAADAACFRFLKETVSTKPLSRGAQRA